MKLTVHALCKKIGFIALILLLLTVVDSALCSAVLHKDSNQKIVLPATKLSLEQIHELSSEQGQLRNNITRGSNVVHEDRFTQSEAHMSLPEIQKLIASHYNIKPYQKIIDTMLAQEKKYSDDYVFYHGIDNVWRVPQDLYTRLFFHFNGLPQTLLQQFIFLRFEDIQIPSIVQTFLISQLKKNGLINDHELGQLLLSVNLAIFGNVGVQPECAWEYFIKSRGHLRPTRATYIAIMDKFGLPHTYIDTLIALVDLYKTSEQTIVQLFIPKNKVDEVGYLSWIRGIPAHKKTINLIMDSVTNKQFSKTAPAIVHYAEEFKREQENNIVFKNLLERIDENDFSLGYFLKFYRNYPDRIENINRYQARLFLTSNILLNPQSGVKIFRYSTATSKQLKKYHDKFETIFQKIIREKMQQNTR
ncbi:MAG TPA: hypothetical protein VLB80_02665 [Candidatus Babeliales bacterium]|nr:hypothetical protein [Candidatus Babeliales bacterium]